MKYYVYSVFDKVAHKYHNPWVESSDPTAASAFNLACADSGTLYGTCPGDFVLFRIGSFDDDSGLLSQSVIPEKVCDGFPVEVKSDE